MPEIRFLNITTEYINQVLFLLYSVFDYTLPEDRWTVEDLEEIVDVFPDGSIIAVENETVVGVGIGYFLDLDFDNLPATEEELIYGEDGISHDPDGAYYYGTDLAVIPSFRGKRIARAIYDIRKQVVTKNNKRGFVAAATVPGYENEKHRMDLETYVRKVVSEDIFDPTLSVQLRNGFKVIKPLKDFFHHPETNHSSALIYWENVKYVEGGE